MHTLLLWSAAIAHAKFQIIVFLTPLHFRYCVLPMTASLLDARPPRSDYPLHVNCILLLVSSGSYHRPALAYVAFHHASPPTFWTYFRLLLLPNWAIWRPFHWWYWQLFGTAQIFSRSFSVYTHSKRKGFTWCYELGTTHATNGSNECDFYGRPVHGWSSSVSLLCVRTPSVCTTHHASTCSGVVFVMSMSACSSFLPTHLLYFQNIAKTVKGHNMLFVSLRLVPFLLLI
mmetsp:Transcript_9561/g.14216  ORF Transcript_9561/g.14216 Transcript_9561/m.14216 type:complete len:230 (-) Transcript_9561:183-872(-)